MVKLIVTNIATKQYREVPVRFDSHNRECELGRDKSCDLRLLSHSIDQRQARICWLNERYTIEALSCQFVTQLDGSPLTVRQPQTLYNSDCIQIGDYVIQVQDIPCRPSNGSTSGTKRAAALIH